ncbi:hypothetical protein A1O7_03710 [Cladophialophora yegresii CBS 114405]|uniref:Uncharacterized protein n=1 Tax=Cladophialophora yegresii CBS 114405 TaxID=1182544 RepID=W9WM96_9EURO|nr:uncharacterized protein A1O7_03710 [Cladophialophora yegresii CBS 114405]EXJ59564.1 hypothetical protein A1O7_03710 [Cladophialophora yegresii CBS 114405]
MAHQEISPAVLYLGHPGGVDQQYESRWQHIPGFDEPCLMAGFRGRSGSRRLLADHTEHATHEADNIAANVNAIARTTGTDPVPESKQGRRYTFVKDKFKRAGLTPLPSQKVTPSGVKECPVVMEAEVIAVHDMFGGGGCRGWPLRFEVRILLLSIHQELRLNGHRNRVDADKWKPMIMMFSDLYGLRDGKLEPSRLAEIEEEEMYRPLMDTKGEREEESYNGVAEHVVGLTASQQENDGDMTEGTVKLLEQVGEMI